MKGRKQEKKKVKKGERGWVWYV